MKQHLPFIGTSAVNGKRSINDPEMTKIANQSVSVQLVQRTDACTAGHVVSPYQKAISSESSNDINLVKPETKLIWGVDSSHKLVKALTT